MSAARDALAALLIGPAPMVRDSQGWWSHPDLPDIDEGQDAEYETWLKAHGLAISYSALESEDLTHPVYISYFDEESGSVADWSPDAPAGEGWFTLSINDTEDGPYWVWARRVAPAVQA